MVLANNADKACHLGAGARSQPLPPVPEPEPEPEAASAADDTFEVVAQFPYQQMEPTDLPMIKGEKLTILDSSEVWGGHLNPAECRHRA